MKRFCFFSGGITIALAVMCLLFIQPVLSQNTDSLDVAEAVICREVVNRAAVGSGTNFPASVGKLSCFTKIVGAETETHITHVWYHGNMERFRINLPVRSASWRTHSTKTIRSWETGVWHVDILDSDGNRLEVLNFHIDR